MGCFMGNRWIRREENYHGCQGQSYNEFNQFNSIHFVLGKGLLWPSSIQKPTCNKQYLMLCNSFFFFFFFHHTGRCNISTNDIITCSFLYTSCNGLTHSRLVFHFILHIIGAVQANPEGQSCIPTRIQEKGKCERETVQSRNPKFMGCFIRLYQTHLSECDTPFGVFSPWITGRHMLSTCRT